MVCSAISIFWYNLVTPFYYTIRLKSQPVASSTADSYFAAVYYITMIINEANFGILLLMAYVMSIFTRARFKRTALGRTGKRTSNKHLSSSSRHASSRNTRANSETTLYLKQATEVEQEAQLSSSRNLKEKCIACSRGEHPKARESFILEQNKRLGKRQSMTFDASTATGLLENNLREMVADESLVIPDVRRSTEDNENDFESESYFEQEAHEMDFTPEKHRTIDNLKRLLPNDRTLLLSGSSSREGNQQRRFKTIKGMDNKPLRDTYHDGPSSSHYSSIGETEQVGPLL